MTDEQEHETLLEMHEMMEALRLGKIVMDLLSEQGAGIVPYLIDTDDNPGERFRAAIRKFIS